MARQVPRIGQRARRHRPLLYGVSLQPRRTDRRGNCNVPAAHEKVPRNQPRARSVVGRRGMAGWRKALRGSDSRVRGLPQRRRNTDRGALSVFREAQCYEALKDKAHAIETYKIVFDPKYNWAGGYLGPGAVDAARHLIDDGAPDVSRQMAMMVVDKSPKEGWAWPDIQNQAKTLLGQAPAKNLYIQPYMYNHYSTSHINIEGTSKLTVAHEPRLLLSVRYASAADPLHAVLTFTPKVDMKTIPPQVTKVDGDKTTYSMKVDSPDAKGALFGDQWIGWMENDEDASPPSNLVLTRKWEKEGSDWGTCTIRLQSSDQPGICGYTCRTRRPTQTIATSSRMKSTTAVRHFDTTIGTT